MTHTMIEKLGMTDVFGDLNERVTEVNIETLLDRNPDMLILVFSTDGGISTSEDAVGQSRTVPGAERLTAVTAGRVIPLGTTYALASPLTVDALETMAETISGWQG